VYSLVALSGFTVFRPFEAASKVLSENIPTARAVVIKDARHFPHMESPKPSMKCYRNGSKRK
jgi:pimeloyl-ACP methyl ester carboxylesterase